MRSFTLTQGVPAPALTARVNRVLDGARDIILSPFDTLVAWQRRHDQRRHMADMDSRLMADAGLTADAVAREIAKPFWQA